MPPTRNGSVEAPHVVIVGAGSSIAAYQHWGSIGPPLPSMQNMIDLLNLRRDIEEHGYPTDGVNFEAFYDELATSGAHPELRTTIEQRVYAYFSALELPPTPTLYDYLVLSLRGKDLIASFNWDPFLIQALWRNNFGNNNLPQVAFLHGNVLAGVCDKDRVCGPKGGRCSKCGELFTPSRLLYPVRQKDYASNAFIRSEWDRFQGFLKRAYFVSVFGYSAPKTDVEARSLMLEVWQTNPSHALAEMDIIDIRPRADVVAAWEEFFHSHHYSVIDTILNSYLFRHPRRSCEALYSATLLNSPLPDNPFPEFSSLADLHAWTKRLIAEETP